jgi:putative two-component system response regulator
MEKLILLVDDDPLSLELLRRALQPWFKVRIATRGESGVEQARMLPLPDLILLAIRLPDMHGYMICSMLKQDELTAAIPVLFLSSHDDPDDITYGREVGAVDFVTKPVATPDLIARVRTHLHLCGAGDQWRGQKMNLERLVGKRTRDLEARTAELEARTTELQLSQELAIVALGSITETRDNETGHHIHRTQAYVKTITERLASLQRYRLAVSEEQWTMIWRSAPLHDIGKVGIPDHILLKPGKLTHDEFDVMKRHPVIGRDALRVAETRIGSDKSFLGVAKEVAYAHHERWDGAGYPEGIEGESIPLSARIMALADVYDSMISRRVYKPAMSHATAVDQIRSGRGTHFDPSLVDCFLDTADQFNRIALRFSDDAAASGQGN